MKKVYIGGGMFTDKEIDARLKDEEFMRKILPDAEIYDPINNKEINDKTKKPTAKDIFLQDTKKVIESDIITADLDDNDEGLAMELGIAYGIKYMIDIMKSCNSKSDIIDKLRFIPRKTVIATMNDIRQDTKGEEGIHKSYGKNQYVVGGVQEMGKIVRHREDINKELNNK